MRAKVIVPVVVLIMAMFVVCGSVVVTNVTSTTEDIVNSQMNGTLNTVRLELAQAKGGGTKMPASSLQAIVANFGAGAQGGVFATDSAGKVVADSANLILGKDISDQSWFADAYNTSNQAFTAEYGAAKIFARSTVVDDYMLVIYMPEDTLNSYLVSPLYLIGVVGLIALTVVTFLIYLLITRLLIVPIEILYEDTEHLLPGVRLDTKLLKRNKQLVEVANSINGLIERHEEVLPQPEPQLQQGQEPSDSAEDTVIPGLTQNPALDLVDSGSEAAMTGFSPLPSVPPFVFADAIREVINPLRPDISQKHLKFTLLVDHSVPKLIQANQEDFLNSITNLFVEVIDASSQDGTINAEVRATKVNDSTLTLNFSVKYGDNKIERSFETKGGLA